MVVGIKILLKEEVLDVQGRAITETLKRRGHSVEDCRYGKFLQLKVRAGSKEEVLKQAKVMAESILCNSLVENYELEVLSENSGKKG